MDLVVSPVYILAYCQQAGTEQSKGKVPWVQVSAPLSPPSYLAGAGTDDYEKATVE